MILQFLNEQTSTELKTPVGFSSVMLGMDKQMKAGRQTDIYLNLLELLILLIE